MAHFESVTVQHNGKWFNIPSVIDGKKRSSDEAKRIMLSRGALGKGFATVEEAVKSAKLKSVEQGQGGRARGKKFGRSVFVR